MLIIIVAISNVREMTQCICTISAIEYDVRKHHYDC